MKITSNIGDKRILLTPDQFFLINGGIDKVLAKVAEIIEREHIEKDGTIRNA